MRDVIWSTGVRKYNPVGYTGETTAYQEPSLPDTKIMRQELGVEPSGTPSHGLTGCDDHTTCDGVDDSLTG